MMETHSLGFLDDRLEFGEMLASIDDLDDNAKATLLDELERGFIVSSSWVTPVLFKPGIRNLFLQEHLGATGIIKKMEQFLGDQDYHFKFFFQDAVRHGRVPAVLELVKQSINLPRFRFRLLAIDMLVELAGAEAVPFLFNLVSGLDPRRDDVAGIAGQVESNLDQLAGVVENESKFRDAFKRLRLALATLDLNGQAPASPFTTDE